METIFFCLFTIDPAQFDACIAQLSMHLAVALSYLLFAQRNGKQLQGHRGACQRK
jgi:hypothetical protein